MTRIQSITDLQKRYDIQLSFYKNLFDKNLQDQITKTMKDKNLKILNRTADKVYYKLIYKT